ncbi:MAG: NUDIX hydrolase [Thermoplasmata archaeon]|uniref:NUDIX hydrolase n=1 Tax=Candidatus Sysuiplasma superficiale TaxID=2823368 RepID=A0A8J7YTB4_9ARCH|nr:NUDIX hydrolase [Candidatus Sysuiplasma superficiale]MBX8644152.1 NUDIX hydrolase [Candidatus Sysuiplasma superficiale]MCL4346691.1 NUDIX hydrolase [Candidatus Thermoplasmatota archaeon]
MRKYGRSSNFSLEPHFDMLYRGHLLFTEEEYCRMQREGRAGGDSKVMARIDRRFLRLMGRHAFTRLTDGRQAFTEELRNTISIYENKVHLSREQLIHRWKSPSVAADSLMIHRGRLLLVRRGHEPYRGFYALPGGIMDDDETLEECAIRELFEETGIKGKVRQLLTVLSDPERDPRVRMVSAVYLVDFVGGRLKAGDDASSAAFFPLDSIPPLAFDHGQVVSRYIREAVLTQPE